MKRLMTVFALTVPLLLAGAAFAQGEGSGHHGKTSATAADKAGTEKPKAEKTKAAEKKGKAEKAVLRKVTKQEIGKEAVCPVTGEKLTVAEDTVSALYKGEIYYFCCPGCDKTFFSAPEKYAKKKPAAEAKKLYVCPMGDYQGDKPGKCPKCGMKLEEKK